ncbi:MAG: hypothetical protein IPK82_42780 [Polyangiaceae bacterium]|nr:hypothetical protein [Polyangiaceae bacterium]
MSNVVAFPSPAARVLSGSTPVWLGPATVVEVFQQKVTLRLSDSTRVDAVFALTSPYEAAQGDIVLAIGNADGFYVIGVLDGKGQTHLHVQGDLNVRASGTLRLSADKAVEITGPEVSLRSRILRSVAETATQAVANFSQKVTELLSVHAGERRTIVDGSSVEQAKTASLTTEEKMTINGKSIYLG